MKRSFGEFFSEIYEKSAASIVTQGGLHHCGYPNCGKPQWKAKEKRGVPFPR